jgi:hypothetical protein
LGGYLDVHPARVAFLYQPYGKPVLAAPWTLEAIQVGTAYQAALAVEGPVGTGVTKMARFSDSLMDSLAVRPQHLFRQRYNRRFSSSNPGIREVIPDKNGC